LKTMFLVESSYTVRLKPVEVEHETEKCVFVRREGSAGTSVDRHAKHSQGYDFFDTWEEAHAKAMEFAQRRVDSARFQLEQARGHLGNIKGMKKPEVSPE